MRSVLFLSLFACGPAQTVIPVHLTSPLIDPSQIKSYQLFVFSQIGRDNNAITCESLLNRTITPGDDTLVPVHPTIEGNFDGSDSFHIDAVPKGDKNRLFYIELFDEADLLGTRVAAGCAPSVTVAPGKPNSVVLDIASAR